MQLLKMGSKGSAVVKLQGLLNKARPANRKIKVDGDFGEGTDSAVREFQQSRGLKVDGAVGDKTWAALTSGATTGTKPSTKPGAPSYRTGPQEALADVAELYIGATESTGNRAGNDERMKEIFAADNLAAKDGTSDGYAWCCSFVSLCVHAQWLRVNQTQHQFDADWDDG